VHLGRQPELAGDDRFDATLDLDEAAAFAEHLSGVGISPMNASAASWSKPAKACSAGEGPTDADAVLRDRIVPPHVPAEPADMREGESDGKCRAPRQDAAHRRHGGAENSGLGAC